MGNGKVLTRRIDLAFCLRIKFAVIVLGLSLFSTATMDLKAEPQNKEKTNRSFVFNSQTSRSIEKTNPVKDIYLEAALRESIGYFKKIPKDNKFYFGREEYSTDLVLKSLEELEKKIQDKSHFEIQNEIKKHFELKELSSAEGPPTITAYYEVRIYGKTKPEGDYQYPVLSPPKSDSLSGENPKFFPRDRWKDKTTWERYSKPIIFLRLTDLHLAQLEGSALVQSETKEMFRINYAADNGKDYISPSVFLKGICPSLKPYHLFSCLQSKPTEVTDAIFKNPRYIFFERENLPKSKHKDVNAVLGPFGSQGIRLISFRSVAMDKDVPLGFPVLLSFQSNEWSVNNHLVFVHDRGNAITGVGRLDYYLGSENGVEEVANNLLTKGKVILLLPKKEKTNRSD
ncbi:MltA domain-containing protein [Leptospira sp. 2 VSF19]|uniref:peptidoglycan lytic exotransglycosylase n=1 Tax=Leptospira soteropolitanensis TaxID=2950025 RepID=A0AAW5VCR1_9LEPT|nr:MltA domain-containing protein [Leptospira soteropolitanensis]MCW7491832.1 MltA domain-containing protein [Leptospira soteropolitanensis]MCW7499416.1 MltA domain-containing protein [Leptospira soteropolitanensis]MCW7520993.1 MltA domain-containing protein [Leptospira soteropolitanensis]MCW7525520.1 MltA domain-containing protein [Leptospira soteropolitanensis]MCW7529386.1 MltA domain-containing protein [Leptospira soteropolitanensis]